MNSVSEFIFYGGEFIAIENNYSSKKIIVYNSPINKVFYKDGNKTITVVLTSFSTEKQRKLAGNEFNKIRITRSKQIKLLEEIKNDFLMWAGDKPSSVLDTLNMNIDNIRKGLKGEIGVLEAIYDKFPGSIVFHDITFKSDKGYVQIDLLAVINSHLVLIEVKNISKGMTIIDDENANTYGKDTYKMRSPISQILRAKDGLEKKISHSPEFFVVNTGNTSLNIGESITGKDFIYTQSHIADNIKELLEHISKHKDTEVFSNYKLLFDLYGESTCKEYKIKGLYNKDGFSDFLKSHNKYRDSIWFGD